MNYIVTVEDINKCLNIIYQLNVIPTSVKTLSTGILFNLQKYNLEEYHFQIICCTDESLDLQLVYKGMTGLLINGKETDIKIYLNDWIALQQKDTTSYPFLVD